MHPPCLTLTLLAPRKPTNDQTVPTKRRSPLQARAPTESLNIPLEGALDGSARGPALCVKLSPRLPVDIIRRDLLQLTAKVAAQ